MNNIEEKKKKGTKRFVGIVLSAGHGSRMNPYMKKQYMDLLGRPMITYALDAFEASDVTEICLVVTPGEEELVKKEVVDRYGYHKVTRIVPGGPARCLSVWEGLKAIDRADYVLIHDGARAFITTDMVNRCIRAVQKYKACIMGMPAKDTIRIVDDTGWAIDTPPRRMLWLVQTPQCFVFKEIRDAFAAMVEAGDFNVTDDGMVMEIYGARRVKMIEGSYENIKITTPDDIIAGEAILKSRERRNRE